ncbi:hypothetical protein MJ749_13370 [Paenibacillus polymyxa]|nr:hypothetical protein [Paenibacillus polymyxa]UMR33690.1 hypothetical protein MJ749_13370 [Paenibacillus polymyxa]
MIRAYTSILCALLLYVGVVSIDRYMLIEQIIPDTFSFARSEQIWITNSL